MGLRAGFWGWREYSGGLFWRELLSLNYNPKLHSHNPTGQRPRTPLGKDPEHHWAKTQNTTGQRPRTPLGTNPVMLWVRFFRTQRSCGFKPPSFPQHHWAKTQNTTGQKPTTSLDKHPEHHWAKTHNTTGNSPLPTNETEK